MRWGGGKQRKKQGEKITKYEIERGDRRDPHLHGIQMDGGVALIKGGGGWAKGEVV